MANEKFIKIPCVGLESKIGEVIVSIFDVIKNTEDNSSNAIWNFEEIKQLHPFFLSVLAIYRESLEFQVEYKNVRKELQHQFEITKFKNIISFDDNDKSLHELQSLKDCASVPICKFTRSFSKIDELQTALLKCVSSNLKSRINGWSFTTAMSYLLSELICNIQEHSHASLGFLSILCPEEDDCVSICIADNGITVHGSYIDSAKHEYARLIGHDHAEALRYSTKGISTKNRPDNESRGYGISTNLKMVVNGLNGSFSIMSGNAFYRRDIDSEQLINLPFGMNWDGTVVMVNIPLEQTANFNVYDYIE